MLFIYIECLECHDLALVDIDEPATVCVYACPGCGSEVHVSAWDAVPIMLTSPEPSATELN